MSSLHSPICNAFRARIAEQSSISLPQRQPGVQDQSLTVTHRRVSELKPYARNARTHSRAQIWKIAGSMREFGFTSPVLIDRDDTIIAGHGRVEAAKQLDMDQVPTIRLESLSSLQVQAYVLADNRLAQDPGWVSRF